MLKFVRGITSGMTQIEAVLAAGYRPGSGHGHPVWERKCAQCYHRAQERGQRLRQHKMVKKLMDDFLRPLERSAVEIMTRTTDIAMRDPVNGFRGSDVVAALALSAKMKGLVKDRAEITGANGEPLRIEFPPLPVFDDSPMVQTTAISGEVHALPPRREGEREEGLLGSTSPGREGSDRIAHHLPDDGGEA